MSNDYLTSESVDDLGRMIMALLSEVWIMRDRMAVTEKLLFDKTGLTSAVIDAYVPDATFTAELEGLRDRIVGAVVAAPVAAKDRSVDAILRRAGFHDTADRLASAPGETA